MLAYVDEPQQMLFTLKMATVMFAKTLDNFQCSTWFIPESQFHTELQP
jgi:hypothetical protein